MINHDLFISFISLCGQDHILSTCLGPVDLTLYGDLLGIIEVNMPFLLCILLTELHRVTCVCPLLEAFVDTMHTKVKM